MSAEIPVQWREGDSPNVAHADIGPWHAEIWLGPVSGQWVIKLTRRGATAIYSQAATLTRAKERAVTMAREEGATP